MIVIKSERSRTVTTGPQRSSVPCRSRPTHCFFLTWSVTKNPQLQLPTPSPSRSTCYMLYKKQSRQFHTAIAEMSAPTTKRDWTGMEKHLNGTKLSGAKPSWNCVMEKHQKTCSNKHETSLPKSEPYQFLSRDALVSHQLLFRLLSVRSLGAGRWLLFQPG